MLSEVFTAFRLCTWCDHLLLIARAYQRNFISMQKPVQRFVWHVRANMALSRAQFTESAVDSIEDRATAESDWQCALYHGGSRTSGIRAGNQTAKQKKRYMLYSHLKWIYNYYFALSKRTSRSRSKKHDRGLKASMLRVS